MADHHHNPLDHPEVQSATMFKYIASFALAMGVMIASCIITLAGGMTQIDTLITIGLLALVAVSAQLYLLFKLDLSEAMIWHSISAAATIPLFFIAIVLTMWMFHYLNMRVMISGG